MSSVNSALIRSYREKAKVVDENKEDSLLRNNQNPKHSFLIRCLRIMLYICRIDPFAIYKSNYTRLTDVRYRFYLSPTLRLQSDQFDRLWNRLETPFTLLLCYISVKYTFIGILQIASCIIILETPSGQQHIKRINNSHSESVYVSNIPGTITNHSYKGALETLGAMGSVLSGSLWSLDCIAILIQVTMATSIFYLYMVNPAKFRRNPMDSVNIRFILDPLRESRRIDLVIRRQLEIILHESSMNRLVLGQFNRLSIMRPSTFTYEWYNKSCNYLLLSILFLTPTVVASETFACYRFYLEIKNHNCKLLRTDQCNHHDVFTRLDLLRLFELLLARVVTSSNANLVITIICSDLIYMHSMFLGLKRDLNECLASVSRAVTCIKSSPSFYSNKPAANVACSGNLNFAINRGMTDNRTYSFSTENNGKQGSIELILLATYVKAMVIQEETSRCAQLIRKLVETILIVVGMALLNIALTVVINSPGDDLIRLVWLALSWNFVNPILFGCAFVYSHAIESEKIAWSILAELRLYQELAIQTSLLRSYSSSGGLIGVLAVRWRKLVESFSLSDKRNSVCPFGMSLTYGQVLRMNFFVLSAVSLKQLV